MTRDSLAPIDSPRVRRRVIDMLGDRGTLARLAREISDAAPSLHRLRLLDQIALLCMGRDDGYRVTDVATREGWARRGRLVAGPPLVLGADTNPTLDGGIAQQSGLWWDISHTVSADGTPYRARTRNDRAPDLEVLLRTLGTQAAALDYQVETVAPRSGRADHDARVLRIPRWPDVPFREDRTAAEALVTQLGEVLLRRFRERHGPPPGTATTLGSLMATVASHDPYATGSATLSLGAHGTAHVTAVVDWNTGDTIYEVHGKRVRGAFTVRLASDSGAEFEAIPQRICVLFGRPTGRVYHPYESPRPGAPQINGITLVGYTNLDPAAVRAGSVRVQAQRHLERGGSEQAPVATNQRLSAVLTAVCSHWLQRPDVDVVRLAAARRIAPERRAALQRNKQDRQAALTALQRQIAQLDAALDALDEVIAADLHIQPDKS